MNIIKIQYELVRSELSSTRIRLEEITSEETMKNKVDYILREGLDLQKTRIVEIDDSGWWVNLSKKTPKFNLYLIQLVLHLPGDLKERLLERVKADDEATNVFLKQILSFPLVKSAAEKLVDFGNTMETMLDGRRVEVNYVPLSYESARMSMQSLIAIVSEAKKKSYLN